MTQVGIFGDALVEQGPEAAEKIRQEAIDAVGEVPENIELEEVDAPDGAEPLTEENADAEDENVVSSLLVDPQAEQNLAQAEADAEAEEAEEDESEDEESEEEPEEENKTAAEVIDEIEAAKSVEEVDALANGDERVTVQRAAEKRKEELSSDED